MFLNPRYFLRFLTTQFILTNIIKKKLNNFLIESLSPTVGMELSDFWEL